MQLFRDIGQESDEKVVNLRASNHGTIVRSLAAAVDVRDRYTHSHSRLVSELSAATARRHGPAAAPTWAASAWVRCCTTWARSASRRRPLQGRAPDPGGVGPSCAAIRCWARPSSSRRPSCGTSSPWSSTIRNATTVPAIRSSWSGEAIPLEARIIAAADAYHAIRSDRPYRSGRTHHEAIQELLRCAGTQFDPKVVNALISAIQTDESLQQALESPMTRRRSRSGEAADPRPTALPLGGTA